MIIAPTSKFFQIILMMKIIRFGTYKTFISREVREAGRGCIKQGGKNCRRELRQEKKENMKNRRKGKISKTKKSKKAVKKNRKDRKKVKKSKTKGSKKAVKYAGNVEDKKLNRKLNRKKKQRKQPKVTKKTPKKLTKGQRKETKWFCPEVTPCLTQPTTATPTEMIWQAQCITDMVAKWKKFNKAQFEFRLANRIDR